MPTLVDSYTIYEIEQPVSIATTGAQKTLLARYLDTDGSGTGTKTAIGNYSTPTIFYIQPPAGTIYRLSRMLPFVEDVGTFDSGSYGNGITLTNGITVRVQDDSGTLLDLTDGLPIKLNTHWARLCYDMAISKFGTGNEYLHARWTFAKSGQMVRLVGNNNERLEVVLNDDFSDLVSQYFMVQGYIE